MDIPLFSGSLLQNQCQGKWRLNLEKASKSLTVIVVNSSPVPGSFIYCKSLHLPELLTSKGFYWSPLGASLMCATIYFNINILHMYRNIYSKRWETDCSGCLGGIFQMGDWSSQSEQQRDIGCINSDVGRGELMCWDRINRSLKVILTFHISQAQTSVPKSLQILAQHFTHHEGEGESSQNDLQMENKTRPEIFPDPICLPFWVSLKVSFKKVICLLVRSSVTMSACQRVICWALSHVERSHEMGFVYTCEGPKPPP